MSSLTPDDAAYEVVPVTPVLSVALVEKSEAALAELSNALHESFGDDPAVRDNFLWADAAIDHAMRDLDAIRRWLEG